MRSIAPSLTISAALLSAAPVAAQGTPIGFEEEFALSTDREAILGELIPGTEDYYFYHCLQRQNAGDFDAVGELLDVWIERHGRGWRVEEIENRQALLTYGENPNGTFDFLQERMGLRFDHERQVSGVRPDLPTRLDPGAASRATFVRRAFQLHPRSLDGFENAALEALVGSGLDERQLMNLMQRLTRPDVPNLAAHVVRNLESDRSRGFGSLTIHQNLLLDQLDECVALRPALLNEGAFVETYLRRLLPAADVNWRGDAVAREAYLDRLHAFAQRLAPTHNSLKAHVLHNRLVHDLALGEPDRERFLAYLRLPRRGNYVNPRYLERRRDANELANLDQEYPTALGKVGNDEPLVRAYFSHFFATEDSFEPYTEFVREDYLARLFAETKILAGSGDMERWYSLLDDPAYYERLKDRVEIEFPASQRTYFTSDDPVSIDVDLKNVDTLLVKVFEIDTLNYYTAEGREVDASINLDGLIANDETTHTYTENPLRRVRRTFDFPSLERPGVYIVEFIGNGISSRAVIRKGRLQYVERTGAAGHVFRVLDESGNHRRDASIRFGGREYRADEAGEIVLPYSTDPDERAIILRAGDLTTLDSFGHQGETYQLVAGIFLDRESLLADQKAKLLVRPNLLVNSHPASLALLEDVTLEVVSRDLDGVTSTLDVRDFELAADREAEHEIQVPAGLSMLRVTVRAKVRNLSQGETIDLACSPREFALNAIDETPQTSSPLLGRTAEGYVLDVLGKNGEPKPDIAVALTLRHGWFADPVSVTLKTDERGRIELGPLDGIVRVHASGMPSGFGGWELRPEARSQRHVIQGVVGETLRVPYQGDARRIARTAVSLLEVRGGAYVADRFQHASLAGGYVQLSDLPPGDYDLWLKEANQRFSVRVTSGGVRDGWAIGRDRFLEVGGRAPMHVTGSRVDGDELVVEVAHAGDDARFHVLATRYLAPYDPFRALSVFTGPEVDVAAVTRLESSYHSGREIGDEYRYILDRRYAAKYPGNMLRRPGLLLNPWALEETNSVIGIGGGAGGKFGGRSGGRRNLRAAGGAASEQALGHAPGTFPNLGFLPDPSVVLSNLRPGEDGTLRVPLSELGSGQLVHVIAVDSTSTVYTSLALPEKRLVPRDRRLASALDPARHFAEQRRIDFVDAGATVVIEDVATSSAETYDSIESVFQLYSTLSGDPDLDRFAFVLGWPELSPEEKREQYSEHACHELHFFLYRKDPAFFDGVVRPYLANKAHKTFLDHWLLEDDLSRFLDPWAFARLNVFERILLTRRLEGERESGARHVRELIELVSPDPERARHLFETALKSAALDPGGGVAGKLAEVRKSKKRERPGRAEGPTAGGPSTPGPTAPAEPAPEEDAEEELEAMFDDAQDRAPESLGRADRRRALDAKDKDLALRQQVRQLYRAAPETREFVEHNYWHRRIEEQDADLIRVNAFWRDWANAGDEPFYSVNLTEATGSFAEMMMALSVMDLPFQPGEHTIEVSGNRLTLTAASPLLFVRKGLAEAAPADDATPILVSQDFYRVDDRYVYEGNERRDRFVTDEFLSDVAYGCQVVLTNPTSAPRELELLLQIPEGAIPVSRGFETRGVASRIGAYGTATFEYSFYFPEPETYPHYPVHVGRDGSLIAFAEPVSMNVVGESTTIDTTSWEHVSQSGSNEEVLAHLDGANLHRLDLSRIAWRMRDRELYDTVIGGLRRRHVYDDVLWSYGIHHGDADTTREYLRHADGFLARCGRFLDTPLVAIDAVERRAYQHIEYDPLFNARAHRFGKRREILNNDLARQYLSLLGILAYRPALDDMDWISVTYYLLLQDRIEEALDAFARVDVAALPTRIQYDYMRAYLDFYTDDHAIARGIAERYRDHPVARWRAMFQDVVNQLDELGGAGVAVSDPDDRTQQQTSLTETEAALELDVEAGSVTLRYDNLESCQVSYYEMDIEFLFSTSPFVQQGSGSFSYIRPNHSADITLSEDEKEVTFDLPAELASSNVLVEVRGGGLVRREAYYSNSLAVQMFEGFGQLRVTDPESARPKPKVYVKVFAQTPGGGVRFHKDGYTDLRGRFDYASLSGGAGDADRFAVLVLSEEDGAVIREVAPPME